MKFGTKQTKVSLLHSRFHSDQWIRCTWEQILNFKLKFGHICSLIINQLLFLAGVWRGSACHICSLACKIPLSWWSGVVWRRRFHKDSWVFMWELIPLSGTFSQGGSLDPIKPAYNWWPAQLTAIW